MQAARREVSELDSARRGWSPPIVACSRKIHMDDTMTCRYSEEQPSVALDGPLLPGASTFGDLHSAETVCSRLGANCAGVGKRAHAKYSLRGPSDDLADSPIGETTWAKICDGSHCELEEGVWYRGEHLRTSETATATACCDACSLTARCVSFNFEPPEQWTHASVGNCALFASRTRRCLLYTSPSPRD